MVGGIIPDKTALSVSNYILHEIIIKFGVPNVITTDRGNEFHNELSKQLGEVYEITRIRTAPYHPAANGEIEIRWRFIKKFIRRNYEPNFKIKEILPRAIFAINGVINSTTGYAPHYLVFGRMPDTPTNYKLPNKNNLKKRRMYNMRHYNAIENERHRLDLLDKARTRIIQKQLVRNEAHNSKYASYRDIAPLDLVLVRVHKAKVPNKSLVPQFTVNSSGRPFVVLRVKGPSVVILDDSRNLMLTEHMNNLRIFNNGKYNKDSLERYEFPTRDNQGLEAIYVPQNKGVRHNKPYSKESFDPASVGVPNRLIPDVQKTPIHYVPFSPYDIEPSDKPTPITDYPLTSTTVNFLRGHLPITRNRSRIRRHSIQSSSEESEAESSLVSSDDESYYSEDPQLIGGDGGDPEEREQSGGAETSYRRKLRPKKPVKYTYTTEEELDTGSTQRRRTPRVGQLLDRHDTGTVQENAHTSPQSTQINSPTPSTSKAPTTSPPFVDALGIELDEALAHDSPTSDNTPLITPEQRKKKKSGKAKDILSKFLYPKQDKGKTSYSEEEGYTPTDYSDLPPAYNEGNNARTSYTPSAPSLEEEDEEEEDDGTHKHYTRSKDKKTPIHDHNTRSKDKKQKKMKSSR